MKSDNIVLEKSKAFAIDIINLYKYLVSEKREYVMSKQILKSGTSIGANIREAVRGQSKADFYVKLNISLKEASETEYWLELLFVTDYINKEIFNNLFSDCEELIRILVSITKTQKVEKK